MARKSMAPKRKGEKQYSLVSFELEGFDGEFTLPKLDSLPLGVASALQAGDISRLLTFIEQTAPDMAEVVNDLSGDEAEAFMAQWSEASGVDAGK